MKEIKMLQNLHACREALAWLETQPDWETAWNNCEQGEWMLWLISKQLRERDDKQKRLLALAVCECVRLCQHIIPHEEKYPRLAIELTERWARGDNSVTLKDIKEAADGAAAYATSAAYIAANATANYTPIYGASHAAAAAGAAARIVAYTASLATYSIAYAISHTYSAISSAYNANSKQTGAQCANIVRKYYPSYTIERIK